MFIWSFKSIQRKMNVLTGIHKNHLLAGQTKRFTYIEWSAKKIPREKLCKKLLDKFQFKLIDAYFETWFFLWFSISLTITVELLWYKLKVSIGIDSCDMSKSYYRTYMHLLEFHERKESHFFKNGKFMHIFRFTVSLDVDNWYFFLKV